jgi:hypothetical protein
MSYYVRFLFIGLFPYLLFSLIHKHDDEIKNKIII